MKEFHYLAVATHTSRRGRQLGSTVRSDDNSAIIYTTTERDKRIVHITYIRYIITHSLTNSLTHSLTHALTHSHSHSHSHSHTHTHTHTHTLTHSHTHTLTHSHTHTLTHPHTHSLTHLLGLRRLNEDNHRVLVQGLGQQTLHGPAVPIGGEEQSGRSEARRLGDHVVQLVGHLHG